MNLQTVLFVNKTTNGAWQGGWGYTEHPNAQDYCVMGEFAGVVCVYDKPRPILEPNLTHGKLSNMVFCQGLI